MRLRNLFTAMAFATVATVAVAKEANLTVVENPPSTCMRDYTPFKLTLVGPVALPPGFWDVKGLEIGFWNWTEKMDGWQIGVVNTSDVMRGWQLGAINVTRQAYGIQIGVVNIIQSNDVPFIPIFNCYF